MTTSADVTMTDRFGHRITTESVAAARSYHEGVDHYLALDTRAVSSFAAAIEHDPDLAVAHLGLALSLGAEGRGGEAAEALRTTVSLAARDRNRLTPRERRQIELLTSPPESPAGFYDHLDVHPGDLLVLATAAGLLSSRRFAVGIGREGFVDLMRSTASTRALVSAMPVLGRA